MILVDTSAWVEFLRDTGSPRTALLYLLANLNYRNNWRLYDSISQTIAPREGVIQSV